MPLLTPLSALEHRGHETGGRKGDEKALTNRPTGDDGDFCFVLRRPHPGMLFLTQTAIRIRTPELNPPAGSAFIKVLTPCVVAHATTFSLNLNGW